MPANAPKRPLNYTHPDRLSGWLATDTLAHKLGERGHYPFGEVWYETGQTDKWKFTHSTHCVRSGQASYERDNESALDYAMFRYDSTRLGRFMTPDPIAGSLLDPQSLNRYAYTRNLRVEKLAASTPWPRTQCVHPPYTF